MQTLRENPVIVQLKSECGSFWTSAGIMQLGMRGIPEEYRYIIFQMVRYHNFAQFSISYPASQIAAQLKTTEQHNGLNR